MAEQLPVVAVLIAVMAIMVGGVSAAQRLDRVLVRAGAPSWLVPVLLVVVLIVCRWWLG